MLDAWNREVWRNRLLRVIKGEKTVKSGYDPRRKKKGVPSEGPEVEKHIESEMIRCFELAL